MPNDIKMNGMRRKERSHEKFPLVTKKIHLKNLSQEIHFSIHIFVLNWSFPFVSANQFLKL